MPPSVRIETCGTPVKRTPVQFDRTKSDSAFPAFDLAQYDGVGVKAIEGLVRCTRTGDCRFGKQASTKTTDANLRILAVKPDRFR